MRRITPLFALPLALALTAGCSTPEYEAEQARKAQTTAADQEQVDLPMRHDPGKLIKETIEKLSLRPDQRVAVDRLHQTLRNRMLAATGEHTALVEALARTIGSGFVDQDQLDPALKRFVRSVATMKPVLMNALNELHRTLDADQRARLVQLLEEHHARHQQLGCAQRGHFGKRFAARLGLSEQQRQQIHQLAQASLTPEERARMKQRHEERWQRHKAALEAFKAETFDAARLPIFNEPHDGHMRTERMVQMLKVALPVLSPEQRTQLARHLEQGAKLFVSRLQADALK